MIKIPTNTTSTAGTELPNALCADNKKHIRSAFVNIYSLYALFIIIYMCIYIDTILYVDNENLETVLLYNVHYHSFKFSHALIKTFNLTTKFNVNNQLHISTSECV